MSNFYGGNTCKRGHDLTVVGVNKKGKCNTCVDKHAGRMTFEQAEHARALYALTPMFLKEIAEEYGVSVSSIRAICQYRVHIPEHMKEPEGPSMCRAGLHDMDAPNGRGPNGICRLCLNARVRNQRHTRPEKYAGISTKHNRKAKGMKGADLSERKSGPCDICHSPADPLHMDHCHETGYVRGWLCMVCNMRIGVLELKEWIPKAEQYLEFHTSRIKDILEKEPENV